MFILSNWGSERPKSRLCPGKFCRAKHQLEGIEVDRIFVDRASGMTDLNFRKCWTMSGKGTGTFNGSFCAKPKRFGHWSRVKRGIAIQFVKENITFTAPRWIIWCFKWWVLLHSSDHFRAAKGRNKTRLCSGEGRVHKLKPDQAEALRQAWGSIHRKWH